MRAGLYLRVVWKGHSSTWGQHLGLSLLYIVAFYIFFPVSFHLVIFCTIDNGTLTNLSVRLKMTWTFKPARVSDSLLPHYSILLVARFTIRISSELD